MKLKLLISTLLIFSSITCCASHITVDQQKVFSELDRLSSDLESDDVWALYIRKFGLEKIMIRFPKTPELSCLAENKESYCIQYKDEFGVYQLFVQPLRDFQSNTISELLYEIKNELKSKEIDNFTQRQNKNSLDISYDESKANVHVSQRVIVGKENVFTLISEHSKSKDSSDEYFMQSFNILNS